ncbi:SspB family protein [Pelagibacterium sp.]|uniref:SspB family protein n=1 Tax=Pelagibacterium sp. TaxID=1967288 RepID=UPI003A90B349
MAQDHIRYDILAQEALRGVVRKVLSEVARTGLPGDHHFFISFVTQAPGVRVSQKLISQYDKEMTIVLQNQYWDLKVSETGFEVGLSFDGVNEMLLIPFSAIKGFFDPSVQFGLQFEVAEAQPGPRIVADPDDVDGDESSDVVETDETVAEDSGEKVVSLDSFRKK